MDWVKKRLLDEAQADYKKFSASLIPNVDNVLGVRLPVLRKIAKEIYQDNWREFLKNKDVEYMEEYTLQGLVIGLIKDEPEAVLGYVRDFVPKIDNWAVCDTFCGSLKFTNKNKKLVWDFILPYLNSGAEFELRFGIVMLLGYFIDEEHIEEVLKILGNFGHEGYYARMAAAWALSVCYVKFPEKTFVYLQKSNLDKWTYNKAIQKIVESFRVDKESKEVLKTMRR
ncbi:MAG: DNA alkylation repair protein [Heliobacteriaceae bacterium]|jgi:3-methyladenine DNA glycosylase AlkD|nr:DNA alkylation repair protein [Heliobacteriaceae bacterium]